MNKALSIFTLLFCTSAFAEGLPTLEATKDVCQQAADTFGSGKAKESFEVLKPYWPLPVQEIDTLAYQTESQLDMLTSRFGKIIGSDYVDTKVAGTSFVKHTFIAKFEKNAIRYVCLFYKPKNEWVVNAILWDDQTLALFD